MKHFAILLSGVLFLYFSVQNGLSIEASKNEDIITRTLYMQKPREPIPSYLSERALPRKIQNNSEDWLQHYKNLLQNWNSERLRSQSTSEDDESDDQSESVEQESHIQYPLPTVVTKYVSPDTKNVFYLIGKGRKPTEAPQPQRSTWAYAESSTTTTTTSGTTPRSTSRGTPTSTTTASDIFSTISEAIRSTTSTSTTSTPEVNKQIGSSSTTSANDELLKLPRRTQILDGSMITPEMAGGAALFLTSLLGTFLPVFDSDSEVADPSESRNTDENKVTGSASSADRKLRPVAPNVKTGYAQVARYQGPRQRRRDPNREDHLRDTQNPAHSVRKFCDEAIDTMEEGLRFENSLSDEALHGLFWELVRRHGIPLSDKLRESVVDNGGHAQQIAVILDALCRSYQDNNPNAAVTVSSEKSKYVKNL